MRQNPASSSASSSMLPMQEVSGIVFSAHRATNETRLLRSKVCQMIGTALQAMADASCKTLRRRVGQRLRRKLGRILMQEEFEQALAIYKRYEDDLLNETEVASNASGSLSVLREASNSPHSVTSSPDSTGAAASATSSTVCLAVQVPVIAVPVLVPVMASAHGHVTADRTPTPPVPAAAERVERAVAVEPVEPVSPVTEVSVPPIQPHLDVQKESRYFARMCTESTSCTGSTVMDDEDFLDQHIDWVRAVSDAAPVERTFIQFNTNMKVSRRSRSR